MCKKREKGEDLPSPFSKIGKKFPDFGKKYLDCGHLFDTLLIKNAFFKVFLGGAIRNISLQGPSFLRCR